MKYSVIIPTYNEAGHIGATIDSLACQTSRSGSPLAPSTLEVVIVDTAGSDDTPAAVKRAAARHPALALTLIEGAAPSMVTQRIAGIEHVLRREHGVPEVIVSGDADTTFPPTWIDEVDQLFGQGHELVSAAGAFEDSLWHHCPRLAQRYATEVGTIFFRTTVAQTYHDTPALFSAETFLRFGRPVSDCAFAISTRLYRDLGGIRQDYYDSAQREPILAVGWPLMFRAALRQVKAALLESPEYETSARRLLQEPEALFSGTSYLGEIAHYRSTSTSQYAWLDHFATNLNMEPLQRYVVKNYILQQCLLHPELIRSNMPYFDGCADPIEGDIHLWRAQNPDPEIRQIFTFADELAHTYTPKILQNAEAVARQALLTPPNR